jgi:threonine/homoserine/homoserine lactone efflux protein
MLMIALKPEMLLPFALFCVATSFTPGPNNFMLMTTALNFGFRKTVPAGIGVTLGFGFLVFCVGAGLGVIFSAFPIAYTVLKYAGSAYLVYLAYLVATSDPTIEKSSERKKPMTFIQAVAFQWVNPKGWIMAVSAISTYAAIAYYPANAVILSATFSALCVGSSIFWMCCGTLMQRYLKNPKIVRGFNLIMATLLIASIYTVFAE